MAFQRDFGQGSDGGFQRQMVQGDWTCSECGAKITELPFQPSSDRPVYCKDCHSKMAPRNRDDRRGGGGFQRQMHQGNWSCSSCGAKITELPFEPSPDQQVYCRDCYRQQKQQ
jgi:CxxC-x17-CxxC domain-containing protein